MSTTDITSAQLAVAFNRAPAPEKVAGAGHKVHRKAFDPPQARVRDGGFQLCAGSAQLESRSKPNHAAAASPTSSEAQMCRPERALLAPQPAPDCGFGRSNLKTPGPRSADAPEARIRAKMLSKPRKRSVASVCACCRPPGGEAEPARQQRLSKTPIGLAAWGQSHPTSHFSAVLDQHCPQPVTFSLYECSRVNSRREFRTETRKSGSESDDEDALRCARGSSER